MRGEPGFFEQGGPTRVVVQRTEQRVDIPVSGPGGRRWIDPLLEYVEGLDMASDPGVGGSEEVPGANQVSLEFFVFNGRFELGKRGLVCLDAAQRPVGDDLALELDELDCLRRLDRGERRFRIAPE